MTAPFINPRSAIANFNRGVRDGIAPVVGQTVQSDSNAAIIANVSGVFSHNGWLFGESSSSDTELLVAQNGFITRDGAVSDIRFSGSYYTSTSAGVYMQVIGTRIQLTVSSVVGSFVPGDIVSQATSNAVGRYVRTSGATMVLALVSGTFNDSNSIAGEDYTTPAIGTNALTNPEFAGAVTGAPGTPPTSWNNNQTTGELVLTGEVLRFIAVSTRRSIFQSVSVTPGVYATTVQATHVSGNTPAFQDVHTIASLPAGTTLTYWIDDKPATIETTWTGSVELKIVATVTTAGTMQFRLGAGVNGNRTMTIDITEPIVGTSTEPAPLKSADVSAANANTTQRFLSRSVDGFEDFYPVLDYSSTAGSTLLRCIVDCGVIDVGTPKKTILMVVYDQTPASQIYYNHPDDNDTWTLLLNVEEVGGVRPIRHWHGGIFIPGLGPNEGTLALFAGDSNDESAIHICDDVADLLANPNTWFERWALHLTGANRVNHLATQTAYTWIYGSQSARTVDLVVDASSEYAYYLPDNGGTNGFGSVRRLHRIDLAAGVVDVPDLDTQYTAEGWYGCLSRGVVILTDLSRWSVGNPQQGSDEFLRAYAVDNNRLVPVKRWRNTAAPNGLAQLTHINDYEGHIFGRGVSAENVRPWYVNARGQVAQDQLTGNVLDAQISPIAVNCFTDPTFTAAIPTPTRATAAVVTDVLDAEFGGVRSLRITPTSESGGAIVVWNMPAEILEYLRGKWVTLSVRYLAPTSLPGTQSPRVGFGQLFSGGSTLGGNLGTSDLWQTGRSVRYIPRKSTAIPVWLYASIAGTDTSPVWFSDVCLCEGHSVQYRNKPFLNIFGITP